MKTINVHLPRLAALLSIAQLTVTILGCQDSDSTLCFSAIPDQDQTRLQERFQRLADYFSRELDVLVTVCRCAYLPDC
jgi:phosphonate transport system substrate-binding protein